MKKLKSFCLGILCLITVICAPVLSQADDRDVVVSLRLNSPIMQVNGVDTQIDEGRGTTPVAINGRTLVPIRAIVEAFGGNVGWDSATSTVILSMEDDTVKLRLDSTTAYFNNSPRYLDVAPTAINQRTMLPIRFVAESFNLGVAWDGNTQTVYIIKNGFDEYEYRALKNMVPEYSGEPYVSVNNNYPFFEDYEKIPASFEYYSDLDYLGRCDVCIASVAEDIMPTAERESISSVKPTGWVNKSYDNVPGGYLYNRCHLIGYQLTGENANEKNLITGTRYLNIEGMLPFENMVDDYIEKTGNHVMYRVTPIFSENNLLADGVLMEACSVEDRGSGISYCVYCYNVQPGIFINYVDGNNRSDGTVSYQPPAQSQSSTDSTYTPSGNTQSRSSANSTYTPQNNVQQAPVVGSVVYRTPTGKRYHLIATCGGVNSYKVTYQQAVGAGLTPCKKCAQ